MKEQLNIFVCGANGRMGKQIISLVLLDNDLCLAGAVEHPDCPVLGADSGINAGAKQTSVSITSDLRRSLEKKRGVVIDFSSVDSTMENVKRAIQFEVPIVIGTTGFSQEQRDIILDAGKKVPVLFTPNMSIGMNVIFKLVEQATRVLHDDFDIEITEVHHRHKVDAPSGTALRIARLACEAAGLEFPKALVHQREGKTGERTRKEVGMQVLRGGDVVGEHTVYYLGEGERIEIKHIATSRSTFAAGAIRSAKWLREKAPGIYDMENVLGLR